ncbi:hypothetical protein Ancab_026686 [Ancistrocladus abbreviatus]
MDTFVKKLVEKASKKAGYSTENLKPEDLDLHVAFHYGIPSGSFMFAYDSLQKILAISTKDGRIKLLGRDNTQVLLESTEILATKFLQFIDNQGLLLRVTIKNQIEVWDINRKMLSSVYYFGEQITSLTIMQQCFFIYVGDSLGNITVLKLDKESCNIEKMQYRIPFSASHGNSGEAVADYAVMHILPQPKAESKRILLIFNDGSIILWAIQESKAIFKTGGKIQSLGQENKEVTSACWACPFGSRIVVGYSSGEILIYTIPSASELTTDLTTDKESSKIQNAPTSKLNLGYKSEKIPIASLKWAHSDEKAARLYVMGAADTVSTNLVQVILWDEQTELRTIKLGLQLPEPCVDMEIISGSTKTSKHKQEFLLLLGKSGHIYAYDDCLIEKYLLQSQTRSPPSIPREFKLRLLFPSSSITSAKFVTNNSSSLSSLDEDFIQVAKNIPPLLSLEAKQFDATGFSGFSKIKNLYLTGHSDGTINFWDATCPIFLPLFSIKQQSEDDSSSSGLAVTAMHYNNQSQLLVSGDQSGMVRIYRFKPEPFSTENSFSLLQGSSKKGNHHAIQSVKLIKVSGPVLSVNLNYSSGHLAVGSDQGYISLIDIEGATLIYQKQIESEISAGVISLHFENFSFHGFDKNLLLVATRDSSVLALDNATGDTLSNGMIHPRKRSKALFMQILDGQERQRKGSNIPGGPSDSSKGLSAGDGMPRPLLLLLCAEKAAYVYSLAHVVQGVKKVCYKKKFGSSSCYWASTFCSPSSAGLILLFSCGKLEIRSLPELSLVKETAFRSFAYFPPKANSYCESSICSSPDGELILVRSDQEIVVVSVSSRKEIYRHLDSFSQVYNKDMMSEAFVSPKIGEKEKKKGIFGSVIKDLNSSKTRHGAFGADEGTEDMRASFEELLSIFAISNFPADVEQANNLAMEEDVDLDIDDIHLDDPEERPKRHNVIPSLNKQKLASKLQSFKGKLKQMKVKNEKPAAQEEPQNEKAGAVDQIKKKYGFPSSNETSAVATIAGSKLTENLKKLQGINMRTSEMQETAKSYSSIAKDVLRNFEHDNKNS